ncbi:Ser/Thr protein phosphatase superfamily [Xylariaceae sp. FL0662B]|nr:Ser/Thr protein phosphatase superfamily [Xylariaceae sp. FL0662B]
MVGLQIISDLHLESPKAYDIFDITPKAPYLALLGDIGYVSHGREYFGFLRRQLSRFRVVFLVMGNHEPWHSTWEDTKRAVRQFERDIQGERQTRQDIGELVVLDRTRYEIAVSSKGEGAVVILGCTLFSRVPTESVEAVGFGVNDFYHTAGWTVERHNAAFEEDLGWLNDQVASLRRSSKGRRAVVLTHYNPTADPRTSDPRHRDSPIRSGFATDLSGEICWRSEDVAVWAFGHTHFNCDFEDGVTGKRVLTNQRGYYFSQAAGFVEDKVVEL